ncbi:uncharacterized protein BDV17DRAFT_113207 [Aspergillus undulatus]|uniref:uncharacterized protein n=1 Tax=Aspergillus undulatus TaxID=1810928 RepID=UPI003CCDB802
MCRAFLLCYVTLSDPVYPSTLPQVSMSPLPCKSYVSSMEPQQLFIIYCLYYILALKAPLLVLVSFSLSDCFSEFQVQVPFLVSDTIRKRISWNARE